MNPNKTILVVEDEEALRNILTEELKREGFSVLEASDGDTGLKTALEKHPDLILLDIILPKMDGLTFIEHLRRDTWGKEVSVIVLTNLSDALTIERAVEASVFDFLVKTDWKVEEVIAKVKTKLHLA